MRQSTLSDEKKDKLRFLAGLGFNRWQKGSIDRLYINAQDLGLEIEWVGPGISEATLCGAEITPTEAFRLREAKTYIKLPEGKAYSDDIRLAQLAQDKFDKVWYK